MRPVVLLLVLATVSTCSKSQKSLEALLTEIGYVSIPRYNSRAVCGAHLALRGEILQLHELRRQVSRTGLAGPRQQHHACMLTAADGFCKLRCGGRFSCLASSCFGREMACLTLK